MNFNALIATALLSFTTAAPALAAPSYCWIIRPGMDQNPAFSCNVTERNNYNGDLVYDITHQEGYGADFSVIIWDDGTSELFFDGQRHTTTWYYDHEGDVRINLENGAQFVFWATLAA